METFQWAILLLGGAAVLAALAQRLHLPYPSLLAVGGALLAVVPFHPNWVLDHHLALMLFVAPVLMDAAYDSSPRDLLRNWRALIGLGLFAVLATTGSVAVLLKFLVPDMTWPVAIMIGAIVAPPDAAAATAVIRGAPMPHRLRTILEGESLINDASALLIFRVALGAVVSFSVPSGNLIFLVGQVVLGSVVLGVVASWLFQFLARGFFLDVATGVIAQFCLAFGLWHLAEVLGLSGILTVVAAGLTVARSGRLLSPAHLRVPQFAVWGVAVFVLNALAFVLIGMQLGPIMAPLSPDMRVQNLLIALAVLACVIVVRVVWIFCFSFDVRIIRAGRATSALSILDTLKSAMILSWAGMRGIVTLATAIAVPAALPDGTPFPHHDLVLLCAFVTVLGTLVLQGLTLRPLVLALRLPADNPVAEEAGWARAAAYRAGLGAIEGAEAEEAREVRRFFETRIALHEHSSRHASMSRLKLTALEAARQHANALRLEGRIGDEAFRLIEEELDWLELSAGARPATG